MDNSTIPNEINDKLTSSEELEERKRQIAYQLWEEEDRPQGKAEEHWARACLIVMHLDADDADRDETIIPTWLKRKEAPEQTVQAAAPESDTAKETEQTIDAIRRRLVARSAA